MYLDQMTYNLKLARVKREASRFMGANYPVNF